ncbi:hypothetical protein TEA_028031 [Camellia sinensis var. sinensis]|uniref:AB hydrolase-1 domain-containing protein n=1 Tax=Camellia sinensis var. sinensis TaxID=542762 RepID=A0A4S4CYT6_CAMSN|nr:hypothetical protein TEA_028031 [Camellia sinensis var. sinensis]
MGNDIQHPRLRITKKEKDMEAAKQQTQSHFILVHGGCHGAWCWYKLKPLLESHGHKVTVLDLAASGINTKKIEEVITLYDYTVPLMKLMESLPLGEKVILVGHSFGGMSLALAMDKFSEKISVAVFLTAFMPDTVHKPSFVIDQGCKNDSRLMGGPKPVRGPRWARPVSARLGSSPSPTQDLGPSI